MVIDADSGAGTVPVNATVGNIAAGPSTLPVVAGSAEADPVATQAKTARIMDWGDRPVVPSPSVAMPRLGAAAERELEQPL
jgi:hypothetical protein